LAVDGLVQLDDEWRERLLFLFEVLLERGQGGRRVGEELADVGGRLHGRGEFAALGQLAGTRPVLGRLSEQLNLRLLDAALAEPGEEFEGFGRLAGGQNV